MENEIDPNSGTELEQAREAVALPLSIIPVTPIGHGHRALSSIFQDRVKAILENRDGTVKKYAVSETAWENTEILELLLPEGAKLTLQVTTQPTK